MGWYTYTFLSLVAVQGALCIILSIHYTAVAPKNDTKNEFDVDDIVDNKGDNGY